MSENISDIITSTELVTPEIADGWLSTAAPNRAVRQRVVAGMSSDMQPGRFIRNGAPIRFDSFGRLIDGQHRLLAIVDSGIPQVMLVVRGLSPESMATIDTGLSRSVNDILRLSGLIEVSFAPSAAAITGLLIALIRSEQTGYLNRSEVSRLEVVDFIDRNNLLIRECAEWLRTTKLNTGFGDAPFAAVRARLMMRGDMDCSFFDSVASGASLPPNDIRLKLRNQLTRSSRSLKTSQLHRTAITIKAFNHHVAGTNPATLMWRIGEESPLLAGGDA